ncbi:NUDIX hydrolase [Halorussus halophilus]|uniref:NUDIX hydrolase n=1 Tax=Halorussus halophilus TaxID=2650975 RepID=UPI001300F674|nr:NUDIX domain-containing protein [Halorussus halophilus]
MAAKDGTNVCEVVTNVEDDVTYVQKACAYITRNDPESATGRELLVFEGPGHEGLQIPKGTIESGEQPHTAVLREITEESGLAVGETQYLTTDVWTRRHSPPKRYVRHFFHANVDESRDHWTHTVTGEGEEVGMDFEYSWVELPASGDFALALDDYVHLLGQSS